MRRKTAQPLTLIEILVACALFSLISYYLFTSFKTASLLVRRLEVGKAHVLQQQYIHQRLFPLFARATSATYVNDPDEDYPYLLFAFCNGVDVDPDFSGPVHGRLYVNSAQEFILEIAPEAKAKRPARKEVLETQVVDAQWKTDVTRMLGLRIEYQNGTQETVGFFLEADNIPLLTFSEAE